MDHVTARAFVDSWETAWNAHDVDAVLTHFAGDVTFRRSCSGSIGFQLQQLTAL